MLRRHLKLRLTVASQQHIGIPSRCLLPDDSTSLHHFIAPHPIQTLSKPSQNNNQIKESVNGWNYCVWKEYICQIVWVSVLIWKILAFLWRVGEDVTLLLWYVTLVLLQKLLTWFLDLYTDAFPFSYSKVPWFLHHEKRKKKHMQPSAEVESSLNLPPPHPTSLLLMANHIFRRDCKQAPLGAARWVTLFSFSGAHLPLQHCLCTTL